MHHESIGAIERAQVNRFRSSQIAASEHNECLSRQWRCFIRTRSARRSDGEIIEAVSVQISNESNRRASHLSLINAIAHHELRRLHLAQTNKILSTLTDKHQEPEKRKNAA